MTEESIAKATLSTKFADFRQNGMFIDCFFVLPSGVESVNAHRVVLSKHSEVFRNFFLKAGCSDNKMRVEIPFLADEKTFKAVIDFMYTYTITITEENMIPILATACMLNMPFLKPIIASFVKDHCNTDSILNFTRPFMNYKVDEGKLEYFPELKANFLELLDISQILTQVVSDKFSLFKPDVLCASVPAHMFMYVLKSLKCTEDDLKGFKSFEDFKIYLIDQFVIGKEMLDEEKELLSSVIDWEAEDSYLHFINHNCSWVINSIKRQKLSQILTNRRKTITSIYQDVESLKEEKHDHFAVFELLQNVVESQAEINVQPCEIVSSIGTLWGSCKQYNPAIFRFIVPSKRTLEAFTSKFTAVNYFVDDSSYYLASNTYASKQIPEPYSMLCAGIDFRTGVPELKTFLEVWEIMPKIPKNKKDTPMLISMTDDEGNEYKQLNEHIIIQELNVSSVVPMEAPMRSTMRLNYIKVIGRFVLR